MFEECKLVNGKKTHTETVRIKLNVSVSPEVKSKLEEYCGQHGYDRSKLVERLLRSFLDM